MSGLSRPVTASVVMNTSDRTRRLSARSFGAAATLLALAGMGFVSSGIAAGSPAEARAQGAASPLHAADAAITEQEAFEIGVEAYHYFYPIISMEITRRVTTNLPVGARPGLGPMNAFHHLPAFPDANFREVVRPNFDTLYSSAWVDISQEPQIISAPDTAGRYYMLPILDMWSNVIAVPGKRTSGTGAASWALVPQGWKGTLPEGVGRIEATTPHLWIIGRTQTNGPADYPAVHKVQKGYTVTPLSGWGKPAKAPLFKADPTVDMKTPPLVQVNTMPAERYFALAADLLARHAPQGTDWSILARMERIGIVRGHSFDLAKQPAQVQAALARATTEGLARMKRRVPTVARVTNGWQMNTETMGVYGNAYEKRAIVAMVGLGANQPEDAIYPLCIADDEGNPLKGEHDYVIHFSKDEIPPVDAFWSITMYDEEGFQVANPINRFAIGDRDALKFAPDGSLTIYIQHTNPGGDKEANWLPSPAGGIIGITMRLYAPKTPALDGRWNPPAVRRAN